DDHQERGGAHHGRGDRRQDQRLPDQAGEPEPDPAFDQEEPRYTTAGERENDHQLSATIPAAGHAPGRSDEARRMGRDVQGTGALGPGTGRIAGPGDDGDLAIAMGRSERA